MCCLVTLVAHHGNNGNGALHGTLDTVLPVLVVYNGEYTVVYKLQTYQLCAHCVLYSQFTVQCKTHKIAALFFLINNLKGATPIKLAGTQYNLS